MFNRIFKLHIRFDTPAEPTPPAVPGGGNNPDDKGTPNNPAPGQNPPAPVNPPANKFAGKSPEELVAMLEESDRTIQGLNTQAARVEELESTLHQILQGAQQQQQQQGQQPQDLFTEEEALELFKDPNTAINKIAQRIIDTAQNKTRESLTSEQNAAREKEELKTHFYSTVAPDLKGYELLVGAVAGQVQKLNPGVHPSRLMPKVAEVAREEIKRMGITLAPNQSIPPNLPGGGTRLPQPEEPTGQQKEINDLVRSRR